VPTAAEEEYYDPGPEAQWEPPSDHGGYDYAAESHYASAPSVATARAQPVAARERTFLTLCIALPREGAEAIRRLDPDRHLTSDVVRRAAAHLAAEGRLEAPTEAVSDDDAALRDFVKLLEDQSVLVDAVGDNLELAWLSLELDRLDREIAHAKVLGQGGVAQLSGEKARVHAAYRRLSERIQDRG
jgi:hypothetical protein